LGGEYVVDFLIISIKQKIMRNNTYHFRNFLAYIILGLILPFSTNICGQEIKLDCHNYFINQNMNNFGCNKSFDNAFCGPAALAMVFAYQNRTTPTKVDINIINNWINTNIGCRDACGFQCNTNRGNPNPETLVNTAKGFGYNNTRWYGTYNNNNSIDNPANYINNENTRYDFLKSQLSRGNLVIVQVYTNMASHSTRGNNVTHWMVLVGMNENGVWVNDPGKTSGSWNWYSRQTFLNSWVNTPPGVNVCVVVDRNTLNNNLSIYGGKAGEGKQIKVWFEYPHNNFFIRTTLDNKEHKDAIRIGINKISIVPSQIVHEGNRHTLTINIPTNLTGIVNGNSYDIGFTVVNNANESETQPFIGTGQVYFLDPLSPSNYQGLSDPTKNVWQYYYVWESLRRGFIRNLNGNANLTKGEMATIAVKAALELGQQGLLNGSDGLPFRIRAETGDGAYNDVPPCNGFYPYIQTLKNYGYTGAGFNGNFGVNDIAKLGDVCRIISIVFKLVVNVKQPKHQGSRVPPSPDEYIATIQKTFAIRKYIGTNNRFIEFALTNNLIPDLTNNNVSIDPNAPVNRSTLAKILVNVYDAKAIGDAGAKGTSDIDKFTIIGDKFELGDNPSGATPTTSLTGSTTMQSGEVREFGYPSTTLYNVPMFFYWSVDNGKMESLTPKHNRVLFTAPIVNTTTNVSLYSLIGTANGKIGEALITITVNPVVKLNNSINVNVNSLGFGNTPLNIFSDKTLTISNPSSSTDNTSGTLSLPGNSPYSIVGNSSFNLAPGTSQNFNVRFQPTNTGSFNNNLSINHNGANVSNPLNIALSGSCTNLPSPTGIYAVGISINGFRVYWNTVNLATGYEAQIASDAGFSNIINQNNVAGSVTNTAFSSCLYGKLYIRVRAKSSNLDGPWSNTFIYDWYNNTTPVFGTISPANNTILNGNSVTLQFGIECGNAPFTYDVYLANWNPKGQPPIASGLSTGSFNVNNLVFNETYYWIVRAKDAEGDIEWTGQYSFTVKPETTPPTGTVNIENGANTTNIPFVNLNLNASDSQGTVNLMRFSNDGQNWSDWHNYNPFFPNWNLSLFGGNNSYGNKTVYVQYKDNSNNISNTFSDNINYVQGGAGFFIVRDKKFSSLRLANEYANSGDNIFVTSGYFDLTSESDVSPYSSLSTGQVIGIGLKNGVNLIGEGANKCTLYWDGNFAFYGLVLGGNNTVQGLTIICANRRAIGFGGVSNIVVKDCILKNSFKGVEAYNFNNVNPANITIQNCQIYANSANGIDIQYTNNLNVYNNVIFGNGFSATKISYSSGVNFRNNIITNNSSNAISFYNTSTNFTHNNVWNNRFSSSSPEENYDLCGAECLSDQTGVNGNISQNPQFINSASYDFRLNCSNSPCFNTGVNIGSPFAGSAPDMGSIECNALATLNIQSNVTANFIVTKPDGSSQTVTTGYSFANTAVGMYGIYPQNLEGYYPPNIQNIYLGIGQVTNFNGNYIIDNKSPIAKIHLNGDASFTQSPYITIFNEIKDEVNGLGKGLMQFSNDGTNWSSPESLTNKKYLWDIRSFGGNNNAGQKTIYAKFSDDKGIWSNPVSSSIEYFPNGKIKLITQTKASELQNSIMSASVGDIIFIKEGNYSISQSENIPAKIRLQGIDKNKVRLGFYQLQLTDGSYFDNIQFTNVSPATSYLYFNLLSGKNQILSNCILDGFSLFRFASADNSTAQIRNNVFKNLKTNEGFINFNSAKFYQGMITNNVFDASISNQSSEKGLFNLSLYGTPLDKLPEINNNIFLNFNDFAISYGVSQNSPSDILIRNNVFFNNTQNIRKQFGLSISTPQFTYNTNPALTTDSRLPENSVLENSGVNELYYNDNDSTTNAIGIDGGIYHNTAPIPIIKVTPANGSLSTTFTFDASQSNDKQTPNGKLQYRWDFNDDGIFDTQYLINPLINHQFTQISSDSIVLWVFDEHQLMNFVKVPNPVINFTGTTSLDVTQYCIGNSISVNYNFIGVNFLNDNVFNLELSDFNGGFSSPIIIESVQSNLLSGKITGNLPSTINTSNNYKVRVSASKPSIYTNLSQSLIISQPPSVSILNLPTLLTLNNSAITLQGSPSGGIFTINGDVSTKFEPSALGIGNHIVGYQVNNGGCNSSIVQTVVVTEPPSSLSATANIGTVCAGKTILVNYQIVGKYDQDNYFSIELSDKDGSFNQFYNLQNFNAIEGIGNINCTLPQDIPSGNGYRLRISASSPVIKSNQTAPFLINANPLATVSIEVTPSNSICKNTEILFKANTSNTGTNPTYQWKLNGISVGSNIPQYKNNNLTDGDVVWVEVISNSNCASNISSISEYNYIYVTDIQIPIIQLSESDSTLISSSPIGNQWYFNDNLIEGATEQFYKMNHSVNGNYKVKVTINNCSKTSQPFIVTALENNFLAKNIKLFPNPNTGIFHLKFENVDFYQFDYQIYDNIGKLIFEGKAELKNNETVIDISKLAIGNYNLILKTPKGETMKRIVKY
jgi:hypothetical protein